MLEVYAEHRKQLEEYRVANQGTVLDYESAKGNKEARSYVFSLRKAKAAIDATRKDAKAESLRVGKLIDSEAKELIDELEDMISVHQRRIDEIERREKDRIAAHVNAIDWLTNAATEVQTLWMTLPAERIEGIEAAAVRAQHRDWEEYAAASVTPMASVIEACATARAKRAQYDAEQVELNELREAKAKRDAEFLAENAAREQAERDQRIRDEAVAKAADDARKAAQKAIDDAQAATEAAQRAQAKAEADAAAAVEAERQRAAKAEASAKAEADRREANTRIRNRVHAEIAADLDKLLGADSGSTVIIDAIAAGSIRNVSITY